MYSHTFKSNYTYLGIMINYNKLDLSKPKYQLKKKPSKI